MRDFENIAAFLSEREIDDLQVAIDARRAARAGRDDLPRDVRRPTQVDHPGPGNPRGGRLAS